AILQAQESRKQDERQLPRRRWYVAAEKRRGKVLADGAERRLQLGVPQQDAQQGQQCPVVELATPAVDSGQIARWILQQWAEVFPEEPRPADGQALDFDVLCVDQAEQRQRRGHAGIGRLQRFEMQLLEQRGSRILPEVRRVQRGGQSGEVVRAQVGEAVQCDDDVAAGLHDLEGGIARRADIAQIVQIVDDGAQLGGNIEHASHGGQIVVGQRHAIAHARQQASQQGGILQRGVEQAKRLAQELDNSL